MKIKQKNLLALSIFMLNLSLSYLQQSFLSKEYLILKKRVEQITEDIQNIVISFEEKQVLEKEIESYKKLYDRPIPFNNTSSDNYQAICLFCYKEHSGSSLWDNIQNIKHTSHCPYLIDDIDEEQKILRWIRVIKHGNEIKQKIHKEILKK